MEAIFNELVTRSITPQDTASQLFTWLDRIVSGEEPPFDDFGYDERAGGTPRMDQWTIRFSGCLIVATQENYGLQGDLIVFYKGVLSQTQRPPMGVSRGDNGETNTRSFDMSR